MSDGSKAWLVRFRTAEGQQRSKQFKRKREADAYADIVPLARVDRTALRASVAHLTADDGAGLAPATVHRAVQILNECLTAAVEDRLIGSNPAANLPLPRIEQHEMRHITSDEVWALADEIDPRYRAFVLLGGFGGLRLGEMLALRWGRIDFLRRRVEVAETLVEIHGHLHFGPPKTKAAVRSVPLPRFLTAELSALATPGVGRDELVFTSPTGEPVRQSLFRRRFWEPAVRSAGLEPLRIHDLRHTAVSLWIADGANPKQVAVLAGHTSVSVVLDRYGHLYPHQDDALVEQLERRRGRSHIRFTGRLGPVQAAGVPPSLRGGSTTEEGPEVAPSGVR